MNAALTGSALLADRTYGHAAVLSRTHHAIATIAEQYTALTAAGIYTPEETAPIRAALNGLLGVADNLRELDTAVGQRLGDDVTLAGTMRYPLPGGAQ